MEADSDFTTLMHSVRAGDERAAEELVRRYEPTIRRVVRLRLANLPLQSVVESMDICQSVMASFFIRVYLGQYTFENPKQLVGLLATMAKSKLMAKSRYEFAKRRDRNRLDANADEQVGRIPATSDSPSRIVEMRELLNEVETRLTEEERTIAQLRFEGHDWQSVAQRFNDASSKGTPESLRKKLGRAIDRVSNELGLGDVL